MISRRPVFLSKRYAFVYRRLDSSSEEHSKLLRVFEQSLQECVGCHADMCQVRCHDDDDPLRNITAGSAQNHFVVLWAASHAAISGKPERKKSKAALRSAPLWAWRRRSEGAPTNSKKKRPGVVTCAWPRISPDRRRAGWGPSTQRLQITICNAWREQQKRPAD